MSLEGKQLLSRIKDCVENGRLCYWSNRRDKPSLGVNEFKTILSSVHSIRNDKWLPRQTGCKPDKCTPQHTVNAEDKVFQCNFDFSVAGHQKTYFLKCFFGPKSVSHDKQDCVIQSFREETNEN
jgi:hypothetical protein